MENSKSNLLQETSLNSRADIEFMPVSSSDSSEESIPNATGPSPLLFNEESRESLLDNDPEEPPDDSRNVLIEPREIMKKNDVFKNRLSFFLAVFNLMNAILGSGILGLADAANNLGLFSFIVLLSGTAILTCYTLNLLLHISEITNLREYEGFGMRSFGVKGKVTTAVFIVLHCLAAICSYIFIIKAELPEVIKAFVNFSSTSIEDEPLYLNGNFLVLLVMVVVIIPLSCLKDIKFLGYSSAFGMVCMLFFAMTVIVKKESIPCPLPEFSEENDSFVHSNISYSPNIESSDEKQVCEPKAFTFNRRTAFAVPTMIFSFMCHASLIPIFAELRKPSISKMQKVTSVAVFSVFVIYMCVAIVGYLTFYNKVQSELLLTYSLYSTKDVLIVVARMMVIVCVTLSIPLLHFSARNTIILIVFRNPRAFSWFRHLLVMAVVMTIAVVFVFFVPNIRDIFGMSGATSSTSLMILLPSAFFIKLTGDNSKPELRQKYPIRRKVAWIMLVVGTIFMLVSVVLIIVDWLS